MEKTEDKDLFENLKPYRWLIIGEEISINSETVDSVLKVGFEHIYIIGKKSELSSYIEKLVGKKSLTTVDRIIDIVPTTGADICLVGFPMVATDIFRHFRRFKGNALIFFEDQIGNFKNLWEKNFKSLKIIELSLTLYFAIKNHQLLTSEKLDKTIPDYFANRGNEIDAFRKFILSIRYRCLKITGLDGIGKKSYLNYLKTYYNIEKNCFEFTFSSVDDSLFDVAYILGKSLSVKVVDKELSLLKKDYNPPSILRVFEKFDKIENASIIFKNIHFIYNLETNEFYDKHLAFFFNNLINRKTYEGNKVYFISNLDFRFPSFQSEDLTYSIGLPSINSRFIKIIMEREFLQKGKPILAKHIMQLDEQIIYDVIGGHPYIAKLFVKACDNASIDTIINDEKFRKNFEDEKLKYLFDVINIDSNAKYTEYLYYISCVPGKFEKTLFESICGSETAEVINYLRSRFFLEIEYYENNSESYEVPTLIRKFIVSLLSKTQYKSFNAYLGNFYWNIANDFKTSTSRMIIGYKYSEFHFREAENSEMLKKLIMLFKEKYLQLAINLYQQEKFRDAFFLFRELYDSNYLIDNSNANFFLTCGIKANDLTVENYFDRVCDDFPMSYFILNTIGYYYYKTNKLEKSLYYITKSIDLKKDSFVALDLYYSILSRMGREKEAFEYYDKKLNSNLHPKMSHAEENETARSLMNYLSILDCSIVKDRLILSIKNKLPHTEKGIFENYLSSKITEEFSGKISIAFTSALKVRSKQSKIQEEYNRYNIRQKESSLHIKGLQKLTSRRTLDVVNSFFDDFTDATDRVNKSLRIISKINSIRLNYGYAQTFLPSVLIAKYDLSLISNIMKENLETPKIIKIAFLAANPTDTDPLRLDRECRLIDQSIQASKERDKLELISKWAVRLPDFTKVMLDYDPQIVHFSGHGNISGLAFENESGNAESMTSEGLAKLFSMFKQTICVILNACYTSNIASAISSNDIYVIGMNNGISDESAMKFSAGFYQAYGAGKDIEDSFRLGLVHISTSFINKDAPTLWKRGVQIIL
ncbi:MAG: hypothetical protein QM791_03245 [Ferruginibacter sp.]